MASFSQRYRPTLFSDVTGQEHITETLRKEVANGTLGHAYLFSGPRGIGKTTSARIFAKALNCRAPLDGEPCNACELCASASQGKCLDILELDAATHTGIDNVREAIIENVRFSPMQGARKIYILDEAHMLSTPSWNALLKTLEEPPAYAFFILATTEVHKVPATIVSRCQRFEFRRIDDDALAHRLIFIAKQEGLRVEEEVVKLITSRAEGCLRDAETLLGQLAALGEKHLTLDLAHLVIPESRVPLAAALIKTWADRNQAASLEEIKRLFEQGVPLLPFFDDLITVVRKLLLISTDPKIIAAWKQGIEEERAVVALVSRFSAPELHDMALMLMERRRDAKSGVDPLFALQLAGTFVASGLLKHGSSVSIDPGLDPGSPLRSVRDDRVEVGGAEGGSHGRAGTSTHGTPSRQDPPSPPASPSSPPTSPTITPVPAPSSPSSPPPDPSSVPALFDLSIARSKWNALIRAVDEKNHSLPFILKISQPIEVRGNVLVIGFQYPFHRDKVLNDLKNRRLVEESLRAVLEIPNAMIDGVVGQEAEKQEVSRDVVTNILKAFGGSVVE